MKRTITKKQSKIFNEKVLEIINKYEHIVVEPDRRFYINTILGKLFITLDSDNAFIYTVYLKFDNLNINDFFNHFDSDEVINKHTFKWNIHKMDMEEALLLLDERLENLNYIKNAKL